MSAHLSYLQAIILGLFQGVTELFPVSSLGHSVLIPALIGGSWKADLDVTASKSPYLAFIVAMHMGTAIAMILYFWRDWLRIIRGFFGSLGQVARPTPGTGRFEFRETNQKLAWMIILGTIPVGIAGVILDHPVRTVLAKPIPTVIFLTFNGLLLFGGELLRRRRAGLDAQQAVASRPTVAADAAVGGRDQGARQDRARPDNAARGMARQEDYRDRPGYGPSGQAGYGDQRGFNEQRGNGEQRGYGDQGGYWDQGYDDRGGYGGQRPGHGSDRGGYGDPRGYGGDPRGSDPRRDDPQGNDPWGDGQFGYDRRGDHGGLGPHGYGDGGGVGDGPRGDAPWGDAPRRDDSRRDDSRRDDPWGNSRGGYDPQGHDQQDYEQQGHYQDNGGRRSARHPAVDRGGNQGDYRQRAYDQRDGGRGSNDQRGSYDQRGSQHAAAGRHSAKGHEANVAIEADQRLVKLSFLSAIGLGASQILALFPGFSRDGSVMVAGLARGLSRQDAARFSFLLSAPVIFAAGVFKAGELLGPETKGIHGPIIVGSIVSGIGAYFALMFLDRFLSNPKRTLTPFAIYCLVAGIFSLIYLGF
ncbi:MAG TPA: undecaprenyl-diphosphate phosphatase [Trebonia sp.]|nr:undecaprenyl-diphosphate phosphatase [Trebonia sp.]